MESGVVLVHVSFSFLFFFFWHSGKYIPFFCVYVFVASAVIEWEGMSLLGDVKYESCRKRREGQRVREHSVGGGSRGDYRRQKSLRRQQPHVLVWYE